MQLYTYIHIHIDPFAEVLDLLIRSSRIMGKTPSLNLLKGSKTMKDSVRYVELKEGEGNHEHEPLSSGSRFFHEPGFNIYILTKIGVNSTIHIDAARDFCIQMVAKYPCFSKVVVCY